MDPKGQKIAEARVQNGRSCSFDVHNPSLWFPVGYGKQPQHIVKATIEGNLDFVSRRTGIRLLELIQRPMAGQPGFTFYFRVTNIPIYCQGTNWIPPDTFLPRMTPQRYRAWLNWAVRGNQNMIRVWGGGLYEDDVFYDVCDELGILIWQEFTMGCGSYPVNDQLLASIKVEPSITFVECDIILAFFCGVLPARYYYEVTLIEASEKLVLRVLRHLSSPYGCSYSNDPTIGDIHSWRVWMADRPRYPYQDYEKLTGRFVSEFGMKAFPSIRTIKGLISDPSQRHPQSETMDAWHMAPEDQRTIALYLVDNLKHENDSESYSWATQVIQAESTDYNSRAFRRLWRGPGKEECAGCLIWQLNDCLSAVSWSLLDSFLRPKLVYYMAKRNYASLLVGAIRHVAEKPANEFTHVDIQRETYVELWASNLTLASVDADLELSFAEIASGNRAKYQKAVLLPPNHSTEFSHALFPASPHSATLVVHTRLLERGSQRVLARSTEFTQPLRHHDFSGAKVVVRALGGFSWAINVTGGVAKAVELSVVTDDDVFADACIFGDNCLDLVPGDEQIVSIEVASGTQVPKDGITVNERHYG